MKKYLSVILAFWGLSAYGQATYNPSYTPLFTVASKPYGISQAAPVDGRTYKADSINFLWRPYHGTTEVLTYLNQAKYRTGQFPIVVNVGGTLNSNGTFTGGTIDLYWFRQGQADSNLVRWYTDSAGLSGALLAVNNLSDVQSASTSRTNLGLGSMATQGVAASGGQLTGNWPSPVVAQLNGEPPSFYLNYNNLTNKPTIPAQFNPIEGPNIVFSGSYPNITFSAPSATDVAGHGLVKSNDTLYADSTVVLFQDTTNAAYDTISIFNLIPSGSFLPAPFTNGTATNYTVSGGAIVFSGPGSTSNYIDYDTGTMSEHFIMTAIVRCDSAAGVQDGIGIGFVSQNNLSSNESIDAFYTFNTAGFFGNPVQAPFGSVGIFGTTALSGTGVAYSSGINTFSHNDIIRYTLSRNGLNYLMTVYDTTAGWITQFPVVPTTYGLPFVPNNTGYPAIFAMGGKFSVLQWTYSILTPVNTSFAIEGNSITMGQKASVQSSGYAYQVGIAKDNLVAGGGGDGTDMLVLRIPEIKKEHPAYALTMMGGNDIMASVATGTWQANLRTYHDSLANNGIPVVWLYPTPRNATNLLPLVAFLDTAIDFANDRKIRGTFYALLSNTPSGLDSIYNSGDGIHPNDLGHSLVADIINDSLYGWRLLKPVLNRHDLNKFIVASGSNYGQSIFGTKNQGGYLSLFGSSAQDGGTVNIQDQLYTTKTGLGIGTQFPGALLDVNGNIRVGSLYSAGAPANAPRFYGEVMGGDIGVNFIGVSTAGQQNNGHTIFMVTGQGANGITQPYAYLALQGYGGTIASGSYNFVETVDSTTHLVELFTTHGSSLTATGGDIQIGAPGSVTGYFDMTNHRFGVGGITAPSFALDVRDHINGITEPANTNSTLMASTQYADRAVAAANVNSGLDLFNQSTTQTVVNYSFSDLAYHTAEVGVALAVNSISLDTLTVSASWINAQTGLTNTYTWPIVITSGYSGVMLIPINAFNSGAVTVTVTVSGIGTVAYNASGIYHQFR